MPRGWGTFTSKGNDSTVEEEGCRDLSIRKFFFILNRKPRDFLFLVFVIFTKFSQPIIKQQLASSPLTILQTSEYGLSNACFVFSLFLYSSYQDFVDLMFFKSPNRVGLCVHTTQTCAVGQTLKTSLKSIKIRKCLAGTASTCSILFC